MKPHPLVILTGPSGAGKDEVMNALVKSGRAARVVTHTSRPQRPSEIHGQDYHFVTSKEFEQLLASGHFLEHVVYGGSYRGTAKTAIYPQDLPLIWRIDASRAGKIIETFETVFSQSVAHELLKNTVLIYLHVPKLASLKSRMLSRDPNISPSEISARLKTDLRIWKSYQNFFKRNLVLNEDGNLDHTIDQVWQIIIDPARRVRV